MAAGSLTAAALRYRPRQALLVIVLAAVVSASAVLGPLYSRAAELSMVRTVLGSASAEDRGTVVTAAGDQAPSPDRLSKTVAGVHSRVFGSPVEGAEATVAVSDADGAGHFGAATARLTSRADLCRHLRLADGSCDALDVGAALVSQRNAAAFQIDIGDHLRISDPDNPKATFRLAVAGIYRPFDAAGDYWFGRRATAVVPPTRPGVVTPAALDAVFASWTVLRDHRLSELQTHVDIPLRVDQVDLDNLPSVRDDAAAIESVVRTVDATSTTQLTHLLDDADRQRQQSRTVVPLLAVQLAVLGLVVLGFVCAAATESRRPEIALSRLRGQGAAGAAGLLMRELGLLVVLGGLLGAVPGWLVARLAAGWWLAPDVPVQVRWPAAVAVAAAVLAGVLAAAATAAPTLRQPLVSLLRRVPPRSSALQVGLVEGALVAVAGAGVVTLLTGTHHSANGTGDSSQGPVALLAPGLMAVAGGLLLAQALVPVSGPRVRRALRSGHLPGALAAAQVARRPALRRLVAIITVAAGLLVFGVDTWAVSDRNRETRAGVQAGAPVVLGVDASDARTFRDAVLDVDPAARFATPVVTTSSAGDGGPMTTAVEPAAFARIAQWGGQARQPSTAALRKLTVPTVPSITVAGDRLELTVEATFSGVSAVLGAPGPLPRPMHLAVLLADARNGQASVAEIARPLRQGTSTYRSSMRCLDGCALRGFKVIRQFGDFDGVKLKLSVRRLRVMSAGGQPRDVDLGPATEAAWQPVADDFGDEPTVDPSRPVSVDTVAFGSSIEVRRGDAPVSPPVLTAGAVLDQQAGVTDPDPRALAPDLVGLETTYSVAGRIAEVPRTGQRGVLVNLDLLAAAAGPPSVQTTYSVWLAADDPAREHRLVSRLAQRGIVVTDRDSIRAHEGALAAEGPALALRLALLAGIVALVLAATVLVVGIATSGPMRARDLAGLRIVGVPASVVRAAAVREHVSVAVLGTVVGSVLGLLAAQAALPRVPLFAHVGPRLPTALGPAWPVVGLTTAACLALLVAVSVVVGRALAASATPERTRQER